MRAGFLLTFRQCPCGTMKALRSDAPGLPRCAVCTTLLSVDDPYPAVPAVAIEDLLGVIDARLEELRGMERPSDLIRMAVAGGIDELTNIRQIIEGARYD